MATITFDTLKFVTRLKESGLNESQAIAITEAFRDAHVEAEVATINLNEEISPIPSSEENAKGPKTANSEPDEAPF